LRLVFAAAVLLGSVSLAAACGSGSGQQAASTAPASAPTTSIQTLPASVASSQVAAATPVSNPATRVTGTVQSVDGNTVTLKEGGSFTLAGQTTITRTVPGSRSDLVPGAAVAVTAKQQPDNSMVASAVSVWPSGPGGPSLDLHGPTPLDAGNLMTNETIESITGNTFAATFPGGGAKVTLTPDVKIAVRLPATPADIVVGATVSASVLNGVAQSVSIS
jgi:hypothetical protein